MRCSYCGVQIREYPDSGICPHCGGTLPERPAGICCPDCGAYSCGNFCAVCGRNLRCPQGAPYAPVQPIYVPVQQMPPRQAPLRPGISCCPKCYSPRILAKRRGFSWGIGILGFFLIPFFGLLLGFCGSRKIRRTCLSCGKQWKSR